MTENSVTYSNTNTYTTVNDITPQTKTVWFTLHGMGYLTRYFVKYFKALDAQTNYIIAPQAPSKYYQDKAFKYVGASWLTKENTELDQENVYNYLDAVWKTETKKFSPSDVRIFFMGYSQGVSIITRWMASRKIPCDYLLLHSGSIPDELEKEDFDFLSNNTPVTYLYGNTDEYITEARITGQQLKGKNLFGSRLTIKVFEGKHEVNVPFINQLGAID